MLTIEIFCLRHGSILGTSWASFQVPGGPYEKLTWTRCHFFLVGAIGAFKTHTFESDHP